MWGMLLRVCYTTCGTGMQYDVVLAGAMLLRSRYGVSGTKTGFAATRDRRWHRMQAKARMSGKIRYY
eukprot:2351466-Rhodomonas_salina.1